MTKIVVVIDEHDSEWIKAVIQAPQTDFQVQVYGSVQEITELGEMPFLVILGCAEINATIQTKYQLLIDHNIPFAISAAFITADIMAVTHEAGAEYIGKKLYSAEKIFEMISTLISKIEKRSSDPFHKYA